MADREYPTLPRHVAIIMDGNGRWARRRGLPRVVGHRAGTKTVKKIVTAAREIGISVLTLYAFSTENWKRPAMEVQALMKLLKSFLRAERENMLRNNIFLRTIGQIEGLPADVRAELKAISEETDSKSDKQDRMVLNLALNYGGRDEIVRAARVLAEKYAAGEIAADEITEELFATQLDTAGLPDPDIIIRTGGEARLSNFLLWQASYAELYITDMQWPDFSKEDLLRAIDDFRSRERRYGKTGEQVQLPGMNSDVSDKGHKR
jgi:undecaprenyl diphosphate synthase